MTFVQYPVAAISTFLWIGFVGAISFMEAWLKFRAPGITLPLGLGIGKLVFNALNKAELAFAMAIVVNLLLSGVIWKWKHFLLLIPIVLLLIQTIWLLPALDTRADLHIQALPVPPSNLHFYYVGIEVVKVICLFIFGITLFKPINSGS